MKRFSGWLAGVEPQKAGGSRGAFIFLPSILLLSDKSIPVFFWGNGEVTRKHLKFLSSAFFFFFKSDTAGAVLAVPGEESWHPPSCREAESCDPAKPIRSYLLRTQKWKPVGDDLSRKVYPKALLSSSFPETLLFILIPLTLWVLKIAI